MMNKVASILMLFSASALLCTPADATDFNIQKLLQECSAGNPSSYFFHCIGRVGGIADMMGINGLIMVKPHHGSTTRELQQYATCAGNPAPSYGAQVQVFMNWAQDHPDRWADPDIVGVITALQQAWPCRF
jgi:hypothetical protein